jgi:hypothetical protein
MASLADSLTHLVIQSCENISEIRLLLSGYCYLRLSGYNRFYVGLFKVMKNEKESSRYEKEKRGINKEEENYDFVTAARRYFSQSDRL